MKDKKAPKTNKKMIAMKIQHLKNQGGFTLVEVLVAMIIFAIGMLGLAGLQTRALQDNQDAYLRTQAIFLANDMSDRIKANREFWAESENNKLNASVSNNMSIAYIKKIAKQSAAGSSYKFCSADDKPDGSTGVPDFCRPRYMSRYDWYRWLKEAQDTLPGGDTDITWIPEASRGDDGAYLTITVTWEQTTSAMVGASATLPDPSVTLLVRVD
ncbi:MAG: type IV pilus modification protein PilV [Methyloprofundus sp.]|nr:type IV pilus modification protein PilV [Methyloprofundus sp.]